ncbi:MAG: hypothetical protein IPO92_20925 [Saprospiraceae bacterium]|nr:hypothetical protein [Saprospiraceae bacterium]
MSDLIIRKAKTKDIPQIYNLVYELAVFENEPDAVKIDMEEFENAFKDKIIDSIVALDDDTIVGITIFYITFSTWREDVCIWKIFM